jgi:hypothetical protein
MLRRPFLEDRITRYTNMTPAEWALIPSNPRQRDTELHAKIAIKYLEVPVPPHVEVKMGQLPEGSKWKLDGHTRSYLWQLKAIPVPAQLDVAIYELKSIQEVIEAYDWFDNAMAAERSSDVIQGAFRANGLHPKSHMLRVGRINVALKRLFRMVNEDYANSQWHYDMIYEAVKFFARQIMQLDELEPTQSLFPPGVSMAVLITLRNDPNDALRFWRSYAAQRGVKDGNQMDAVQALIEGVQTAKLRATKVHADYVNDMFSRAIAAFFVFQAGQAYAVGGPGVKPISMPSLKRYIMRRPAA